MTIDTATNATSAVNLRDTDMPTLVAALQDQNARAIDVVVPANKLRAEFGAFHIDGIQHVGPEGVTDVSGYYEPTRVGDEGVAGKLEVPVGYLGKCRRERIGLYDENVNGWLDQMARGDQESRLLLRLLLTPGGPGTGIVRAVLSKNYRCIDNLDVALAVMQGVRAAGIQEPVFRASLTDRRMSMLIEVPSVSMQAPDLLAGYRDPWTGRGLLPAGWTPENMNRHNAELRRAHGQEEFQPHVVWMGIRVNNSDTGGARFTLTPEVRVQICGNGLQVAGPSFAKTHLGGKLDAGQINWSDETIYHNRELVKSQTVDAITSFLNPEFLGEAVTELSREAGIPVDDPVKVVTSVSQSLGFTKDDAAEILAFFVAGGQVTAGGVMNAVTAYAQTVPDADRALDVQAKGVEAMHAAAALARR